MSLPAIEPRFLGRPPCSIVARRRESREWEAGVFVWARCTLTWAGSPVHTVEAVGRFVTGWPQGLWLVDVHK